VLAERGAKKDETMCLVAMLPVSPISGKWRRRRAGEFRHRRYGGGVSSLLDWFHYLGYAHAPTESAQSGERFNCNVVPLTIDARANVLAD